jgi:hypothetical protein
MSHFLHFVFSFYFLVRQVWQYSVDKNQTGQWSLYLRLAKQPLVSLKEMAYSLVIVADVNPQMLSSI